MYLQRSSADTSARLREMEQLRELVIKFSLEVVAPSLKHECVYTRSVHRWWHTEQHCSFEEEKGILFFQTITEII